MEKSNHIQRQRLFVEVSKWLEDMIFSQCKPGDKLPSEQALADKFGVSRNVIREAYKSLVERGLVTIKQGKGTFVTSPDSAIISKAITRVMTVWSAGSFAYSKEK